MQGVDTRRLFDEMRLHPWIDEQQIEIQAWLGRLYVESPEYAAEMQKKYDKKMIDYIDEQNRITGFVPAPWPHEVAAAKAAEEAAKEEVVPPPTTDAGTIDS